MNLKNKHFWFILSSSNAAVCLMHLPEGNIGAGIIIGGLHATMKLLSSIQAQVIQSLVSFQPAQLRQLISSRIAVEWGQKTALWGPREELGDRMPFIIRGRPLRGKSKEPE